VTGFTRSSGWASGGFDTSYNGEWDIFVTKLTDVVVGPHVDVWLVPRLAATSWDTSPALPTSDRGPDPFWRIETGDYFVEVWVRSDQADPSAITGGRVRVRFNANYAQAVSVGHAGVFTLLPVETIDNAAGVVTIGGEAPATDMGDDEYVCLGRILFQGIAPVDEVAHEAGPYDMALTADAGMNEFELAGVGFVNADIQPAAGVDIRANIYDIDDNGQVTFHDFTYYAQAYGGTVGQEEQPFYWWADYDRNGQVGFNDFTYFAAAYMKPFGDRNAHEVRHRHDGNARAHRTKGRTGTVDTRKGTKTWTGTADGTSPRFLVRRVVVRSDIASRRASDGFQRC